jgi:hypothetical protein
VRMGGGWNWLRIVSSGGQALVPPELHSASPLLVTVWYVVDSGFVGMSRHLPENAWSTAAAVPRRYFRDWRV